MRVLVATDGSAAATVGVELAASITWPPDVAIRVTTAIDPSAALFGGPWPGMAVIHPAEIEAELRGYARRSIDAGVDQLRHAGLNADATIVEGRPATAIVEEARRFGADLIILGARGHGVIEEMVLGSVSAEVLDTAPVPVLIARDSRHLRILLAWDGSAAAERAASLLETWPIFRGSTIRVVTVTETDLSLWAGTDVATPEVVDLYLQALDEARAERRRLADSMAARLERAGLSAEAEVREGAAGEQLLAAAKAWEADVIVMGTHARTGLARLALGSVARSVVHHSRTSVLVVREAVQDEAVTRS
jgi:nucleotide-binding universal stress UspA family protein